MLSYIYYEMGATPHKTNDVAGASDVPAAGWCLATITVFHTSAVFLTHGPRDESKVFPFSHELKHLKVYKSVRLQKTALCRGGAARVGNVFFLAGIAVVVDSTVQN